MEIILRSATRDLWLGCFLWVVLRAVDYVRRPNCRCEKGVTVDVK
jgi:hypothetical protein